ncbi:Hypothetical_protein [Hexamita inflata]|uniref:Hypothetical_protein n=1 Tax=Hexamita inflata TaxID=28002 RepID=A0ABP1L3R5_9EUKA
MEQLQQRITIPTQDEGKTEQQHNIIKYQTVIFTLYSAWVTQLKQELLMFAIQLTCFITMFSTKLLHMTIIAQMGIVCCIISFVINQLNSCVLIAVNSSSFFKFGEFDFKQHFQYNTCYQYLCKLFSEHQLKLVSKQSESNNLFTFFKKQNQPRTSNQPIIKNTESYDSSDEPLVTNNFSSLSSNSHKATQIKEKLTFNQFKELTKSKLLKSKTLQIVTTFILLMIGLIFGLANIACSFEININTFKSSTNLDFEKQFIAGYASPYCGVRANFDFNKCLCNNCA